MTDANENTMRIGHENDVAMVRSALSRMERVLREHKLSCLTYNPHVFCDMIAEKLAGHAAELARAQQQHAEDLRVALGLANPVVEQLARELSEARAENERRARRLDELLAAACREPLGVDISDFSDEFCAGYLAGQENALAQLAEPWLAAAQEPPGRRR